MAAEIGRPPVRHRPQTRASMRPRRMAAEMMAPAPAPAPAPGASMRPRRMAAEIRAAGDDEITVFELQ